MGALNTFLEGVWKIHATGEAVDETSYYGQLESLLNGAGGQLSPKVLCVLTTKNRGAGIPDGGLFVANPAVISSGADVLLQRSPERGVIEAKGPSQKVEMVAKSKQVAKYLERYGKVLVTTYREFLAVSLDHDGNVVLGEKFTVAPDEASFWAAAKGHAKTEPGTEAEFDEFLKRVLLANAPLGSPQDLAWFLAAYARLALERIDAVEDLDALDALRSALEDALGLRFEGEEGERFFRSALVQTLFYGVFAAWTYWSEQRDPDSPDTFSWQSAQWSLNVPMVRVLFEQLATPTGLPAGLGEILDWTDDVLARVDRKLFFKRFEARDAVIYFYEPFLQAYDPEMRKDLGVWYTPDEVVRFMVERVNQTLKDQFALPLGLADNQVHLLDPCTGTGSFLVAAMDTIVAELQAHHGDDLVAEEAKAAALSRVYGFELLPAPFVIAHLQLGLMLQRLGVPLDPKGGERARVYLTNSLTGWEVQKHPPLPFPEIEQERDAADEVKRTEPILVVIGNPPYNGFAGVSPSEEGELITAYKEGLAKDWDITKNKLDDLYVRFWRVAERRIAEQTQRGVVCFISNYGWLGDPTAVVMRKRLLAEFDVVEIDNLNGDSRETGKKTPDGDPDPSIFSGPSNTSGIQVGTAISLLVRRETHDDKHTEVRYRDFWGTGKRDELVQATKDPESAPAYQPLAPDKNNWYRLRPWNPRQGYGGWWSVTDIAAEEPMLGLNENRGEALIDTDEAALAARIANYLDEAAALSQVDERLRRKWAGFKPDKTRERLLRDSPFDPAKIATFQFKPFDVRSAYVDLTAGLWNRSRPMLVHAAELDSGFLLARRRAPRALDGAALFYSSSLVDQHVLHKDAYAFPFLLGAPQQSTEDEALFAVEDPDAPPVNSAGWRPNLSDSALRYLSELGICDADENEDSAALLWLHALAVGYSPLYLEQNADAIRNDWPRVPFPEAGEESASDELEGSAQLGARLSALLDIRASVSGLDTAAKAPYKAIAGAASVDGKALTSKPGVLAVTAGWGTRQSTGAVMPSSGKWGLRERTSEELAGLDDAQLALVGEKVLDVYLNDHAMWRGVPEAAWDFKIGGFQVLRKWLSYREHRVIERDLVIDEVRQFTRIARRLTAIVLLGPELDQNYLGIVGSPEQEALDV